MSLLTLQKFIQALTLICFTISGIAQTPQWNWAKSAGGSVQENVIGNYSTIKLDSTGNVYELVSSNSSNPYFGAFGFNNPRPTTPNDGGQSLLYFVKYSPQGTVLWAKQYRNLPDGYVLPGPNSMFVRPDGTAYLHFAMTLDSIVIGGKVARNPAINFFRTGYCIAQYDANGNVVNLTTHTNPHAAWQDIMPLGNNQMLALTNTNTDTIGGTPVRPGTVLAILDSVGNVIKVKPLGRDSNGIFNYQPVLSSRYIAINQSSIYLLMTPNAGTRYNQSVIPFDSVYTGTLLVKLDTGLNFKWAKPVDKHFGALIATDELDNVYLPYTAQSRDTLIIDAITIPFPFRYLDHFYTYFGLAKINGSGAAQWVDTILITQQSGGYLNSVCTDRLGNSYLQGQLSGPTYFQGDTIYKPGNLFVAKYNPTGKIKWVQSTDNGSRIGLTYNCMADDGRGNIYINGIFADVNVRPFFGKDSLVVRPPINNYPLAGDVFLARLGNCNSLPPTLSASSALSWCGTDSVVLNALVNAGQYLWSTGNTDSAITAHNSGIYSVYVADTLGCYAQSKADTVLTYPQPIVNATVVQVGGTETAIATAAGGTPGYSFVWNNSIIGDTISNAPTGWYYVVVTDTNGCTANDSVFVPLVTSAYGGEYQNPVFIYPNPAIKNFTIATTIGNEQLLQVFDVTGRLKLAQAIQAEKTTIDVTSWPAGMYIVSLKSERTVTTQKLVIQHR